MGNEEKVPTTRLAEELVSAVNRFTVLLRGELRQAGVTLPQARALSALFTDEPQRITELAESEQVTQPAMTSLVNSLERKGLVVRRTAADDRRAVEVSLTPAGREMMRAVRRARIKTVDGHLAELPPDEHAILAAGVPALGLLNENIRKHRHAAARGKPDQ